MPGGDQKSCFCEGTLLACKETWTPRVFIVLPRSLQEVLRLRARHDEPMQHCGYDHNGCIMSSSLEVVHQQECNMCGDVGFADQFQHS